MNYEYGIAPIHYIDGVPAKNAGEWPGIKPCKFSSYKRVIRPIPCGIFDTGNDTYPFPKRKLLGKSNSCEKLFDGGIGIVKQNIIRKEKIESIKCNFPPIEHQRIINEQKRHYFPYIEERERNNELRKQNMSQEDNIKEEFRHLGLIGVKKKPIVTNWEIFAKQRQINKGLNYNNLFDDDNGKSLTRLQRDTFRSKQRKEINKMQRSATAKNLTFDINYVKNLSNWENQKFGQKEIKKN